MLTRGGGRSPHVAALVEDGVSGAAAGSCAAAGGGPRGWPLCLALLLLLLGALLRAGRLLRLGLRRAAAWHADIAPIAPHRQPRRPLLSLRGCILGSPHKQLILFQLPAGGGAQVGPRRLHAPHSGQLRGRVLHPALPQHHARRAVLDGCSRWAGRRGSGQAASQGCESAAARTQSFPTNSACWYQVRVASSQRAAPPSSASRTPQPTHPACAPPTPPCTAAAPASSASRACAPGQPACAQTPGHACRAMRAGGGAERKQGGVIRSGPVFRQSAAGPLVALAGCVCPQPSVTKPPHKLASTQRRP